MFITKKKYKELENRINKLETDNSNEEMYKFYTDRKIEEINSKLENKLSYEVKSETQSTMTDTRGYIFHKHTVEYLKVRLSNRVIAQMSLSYFHTKEEIYIKILEYLNTRNIEYFKQLDKEITKADKKVNSIINKDK